MPKIPSPLFIWFFFFQDYDTRKYHTNISLKYEPQQIQPSVSQRAENSTSFAGQVTITVRYHLSSRFDENVRLYHENKMMLDQLRSPKPTISFSISNFSFPLNSLSSASTQDVILELAFVQTSLHQMKLFSAADLIPEEELCIPLSSVVLINVYKVFHSSKGN